MRKPSKFLALLLALSTAVALSACGAKDDNSASPGQGDKDLRLGLVLPDLTNQTISDIYSGAKTAAKRDGNVEITQGGQSATQAWLNACNQIVSAGIDVLAYDTLDAKSTSSCIKKANELNIPTICVFACTAEGVNDVLVTLDFEAVGVKIGKWMAAEIGPDGGYGLLAGPAGDGALQALQKGYLEAVKSECPGCELVANVPAGGTTAAAGYTSGLAVLTANPDIKGIYAANDDVAQGLARAVGQANKTGKVKVAGVNGTCVALESILKGQQDFTVLVAGQPFGEAIVAAAQKLVKKEKVEKTVNVSFIGVDQKTANEVLATDTPEPSLVDLKERLTRAKNGCK